VSDTRAVAALWHFHACPLPVPLREVRGRVLGAADADTLSVDLEVWRRRLEYDDVRLVGFDAYELRTGTVAERQRGAEARAWVLSRVVGRWCYVRTTMERDKYGRLLGAVFYVSDAGGLRDLAADLRAAGYEKPAGA
jgi:endonuclease YncB( thermonuclease family)